MWRWWQRYFVGLFGLLLCAQDVRCESLEEWLNARSEMVSSATIGIHVVDLKTGKTLYSLNEKRLLKPASAAKVVTGAMYLDTFGTDFRISTPIYLLNPTRSESGKWQAEGMIISGRGDISLGARFYDWNYNLGLSRLTSSIKALNLEKINGPLILEDNYFVNSKYGTGWTWEDLHHYYGAPTSSLTNDDNVVDLFISPGTGPNTPCRISAFPSPTNLTFINKATTSGRSGGRSISISRALGSNVVTIEGSLPDGGRRWVDSVSVDNPADWLGVRLQTEFPKLGIQFSGVPKVIKGAGALAGQAGWTKAGEVTSFTSTEKLQFMMKRSQNLYAQTFLLQAGRKRADHDSFPSTELAGIATMSEFARKAGVEMSEFALDEGSGLSRSSLISPRALTEILVYMDNHRLNDEFRQSLPIAGIDGPLRNRLSGNATRNRVFAKSGSIKHVKSLAGYLHRIDGNKLAFTIFLNAWDESTRNPAGKSIIDQIVQKLATENLMLAN